MPGLIAFIYAHINVVRLDLWHVIDKRPRALCITQIDRLRYLLTFRRRRARINSKNVEILVAIVVLGEENVSAIPAPEISRDRAFLFCGERPSLVKGLVDSLDPDVADIAERFDKGNVPAVRRNLRAGV